MSSTASHSRSIEEDHSWPSGATEGSARGPPRSEHSDPTTIPQTTKTAPNLSANKATITPDLTIEHLASQVQEDFCIEVYKSDDDDMLSELDTAMAEDFIPACVERMSSFIQNFETFFNQT